MVDWSFLFFFDDIYYITNITEVITQKSKFIILNSKSTYVFYLKTIKPRRKADFLRLGKMLGMKRSQNTPSSQVRGFNNRENFSLSPRLKSGALNHDSSATRTEYPTDF